MELVDSARRSHVARRWHQLHKATLASVKEEQKQFIWSEPLTSTEAAGHRQRPGHDSHAKCTTEASRHTAKKPKVMDLPRSKKAKPVTCKPRRTNIHSERSITFAQPQTLSPMSRIESIDPFSILPGSIPQDAFPAIQYFEAVWIYRAFLSATDYGRNEVSTRNESTSVLRLAMSDDLSAHAFLAAILCRMETIERRTVTAHRHASLAIYKLKKGLQGAQIGPNKLAFAILFLAVYETYCMNIEGAKVLLRALNSMRGQTHLPLHLRRLCNNVDLFTAASSMTPPVFKEPVGPQFSPAGWSSSRFNEYKPVLGYELLSIIQDVVALVRHTHALGTVSDPSIRAKLALDAVAWSEDLTRRALEHTVTKSRLKLGCVSTLLRGLSYLPSIIMVPNPEKPGSILEPSTDFLKLVPGGIGESIMSMPQDRQLSPSEALLFPTDIKTATTATSNTQQEAPPSSPLELWILAAAIFCAVDHEAVEPIANQFVQLAMKLNITTNVCSVLREFMWIEDVDQREFTWNHPTENGNDTQTSILNRLLHPPTREKALQTVVGWAKLTSVNNTVMDDGRDQKVGSVVVTNRPSNRYRLGA